MFQPLHSREHPPLSLRIDLQRWEHAGATTDRPLSTPERAVAELNLSLASVIAVFGTGPDVFASTMAEHVSAHGVVYSFELTDEVVSHSVPRPPVASTRGCLRMRHKETARVPLADETVDLVVWAFALRTLGHVATMLEETRRILRPGGRVAVVDWIRQEESSGPRRDDRVSAATCERCLAAGGFGLVGQRTLNASHYMVVGRRPLGDAGWGLGIGTRTA